MAISQILPMHRGVCDVRGSCAMIQKMLVIAVLLWLSVATADNNLSLNYSMEEEVAPGTSLGNILQDTGLSQRYNSTITDQMHFSILKGAHAKYFKVRPASHILKTSDTPLDRDVICPKAIACVIELDLAISEPIRLFEIIKVHISIEDLNDNAPHFPNPTATIYISENSAPGTASILPIAIDDDSGPAGDISYVLSPESSIFSLEYTLSVLGSPEMRLILSRKLDRETLGDYQLQIAANDGGNPSLSGSLSLTVVVTDTNDNFPIFDESLYNVSIPENYPLSTSIVTVHAADADVGDNGVVVYRFSPQTELIDGKIFAIDASTGELFLLSSLDYETKTSYHLTVLANDKGPGSMRATARILVHVKDVNDFKPKITVNVLTASGRAEVTENKASGTFVAHVSVEDLDGGPSGHVTCNISNTDHDMFSIVQIYGKEFKIMTNDSFDRETQETVTLSIRCTDSGRPPMSSTKELQVNILDVNDNAPRFSQGNYTTSVRENNTFPSSIFYVSAVDADWGDNGDVTYSLERADDNYLKVDGKSGMVSTNGRLDREVTDHFVVKVFAVDNGEPQLTGTATIRVIVDDINDEAPYFTQDTYVFGTFENQPIGTAIGQVIANDDDTGPRAKVVYTLTPDTKVRNVFKIHPESGRISTKRILDREDVDVYVLVVMATNTMHPYASATSTVSIHIADKNDQAPTIMYPTKTNNSIHISAYARKGLPITRIQASDSDLGKNALLVFQFAKGNEDKSFSLNPASGEVILQKDLDGTEDVYPLLVVVQDQGTPKKTSVANLYIILNTTIGVPVGTIDKNQVSRVTSERKPELTMEVTIVIIVGCLSVVLAGSLSALLVFLCRRYRTPEPKNKPESDFTMYSGVRRAPEDGMEELTVTPLTSVTLADSLEPGSPGESSDRVDMWITDANKIEEVPHLDSGHGSWAESGSECGNISLECGTVGPRGYYRRPMYPEGQDQVCKMSSDPYVQMMPVAAPRSPQLHVPVHQGNTRPGYVAAPVCPDGFNTADRPETLPHTADVRPPRPAVPPRRTVFIPGPPQALDLQSPQKQKVCYSMEDLMKLPGNKLNVVKNQFSESDFDSKSQGSRFGSFSSSTGPISGPNSGSRQSSFSSGRSQESKPLTSFQGTPEVPEPEAPSTPDDSQEYHGHPRYANCPGDDPHPQYVQKHDEELSLAHAPCLPETDDYTYCVSDC